MNQGHFKLGLFVIASVALLALMLVLLGMLDRFRPSVTMETYFFEPIEGLQPGAAVRFRGVPFGRVRNVGFVEYEYGDTPGIKAGKSSGSIVYVEMVIGAERLDNLKLDVDTLDEHLKGAVADGLRTRITTSGIGGPAFVQVDYLDPERFPAPDLPWTPEHLYIPSAPSTVRSIIDALAAVLMDFEEADVVNKLGELGNIGPAITRLVDSLEEDDVLATASTSLAELRAASSELRELLADPRIDVLLDATTSTLASARSFLDEGREDVKGLVAELISMADALERAAASADGLVETVQTSDLVPKVRAMADALGPAGRDLALLADRLQRLIDGNDAAIADTIRSLRRAALELEALLEDAQANPSRLLFGQPPERRTPGDDR
ncbi:MAG: MCE family protein [Planctomycetes bacterium]|nr:MCE family protein [Planctomycetota bacterium]